MRAVLAHLASTGWSESHADSGALRFELWVPARQVDAAQRLREALAVAGLPLTIAERPQEPDWQDGLRRHHQPILVGRVRIRPPWEPPLAGTLDIEIDPGMAFGTGQHATTCGCLELLQAVPAGSVLDVGCGTGVLAIAAARLGHAPITAIDNDPLAVEATLRNAAVNGVTLDVALADAAGTGLPAADTIVANITRMHVAALAEAIVGAPPRGAILSGFLEEDAARALAPWLARGFVERARVCADGWAAVRIERAA